MADEHEEGTSGGSLCSVHGTSPWTPCAHRPGLLSRRSVVGDQRPHSSQRRGRTSWERPFCNTYCITRLCERTQLPERSEYHSTPKPHGKMVRGHPAKAQSHLFGLPRVLNVPRPLLPPSLGRSDSEGRSLSA
ncbi:hypothetical protein P7K49_009843 [Saguinus oedipus]|uniref:Uncharacterized protein n=1 Tax=Saguinus oedipus TaxID=9490 RepID=A0ABQ9VLI5_SAGOE|nr:hypothetical protein P7K49_009843 [Saguinus oedipus]